MEKIVIVLAPNGRRQTIKVNLNSTVLQILEEVCKKHDLKPEKYNIKHHNRCLDTSTIIRFSGLPNNAQLELSEAVHERADGIVTLGIQCENGNRFTGTFDPNSNMHEILNEICPEEINPDSNPVLIYMRRKIFGETSFKETTLRSLGLTNGRAMLRLVHKSPDELFDQANVSAPLPSRPVEEKPYVRTFQKVEVPPRQLSPVRQEIHKMEVDFEDEKPTQSARAFQKETVEPLPKPTELELKPLSKGKTVAEEDFVFVGPRNAMIFSQETAEAVPPEDLPDDFFELTITDAKKLLKDIKKQRIDLQNAPLQTSRYRNLLKSTDELNRLNRYKKSIIRVRFPNQMILQGAFKPIDTIKVVRDFVREYLENPSLDFYLYTTPPINILNLNSKLIEIDCVPNAVLHFGIKGTTAIGGYLKNELAKKCTTASIASLAAAKMRQESMRPAPHTFNDDERSLSDFPSDDVNVGASTSSGQHVYENYPSRVNRSPDVKFPKWFKPPK